MSNLKDSNKDQEFVSQIRQALDASVEQMDAETRHKIIMRRNQVLGQNSESRTFLLGWRKPAFAIAFSVLVALVLVNIQSPNTIEQENIEALELSYPLRIHRYEIRENSGGKGEHSGGDGLIREYEILTDKVTLNIQSERRIFQPYGLEGGENGIIGNNIIIHKDLSEEIVPGRLLRALKKGDRIIIKTPGGGDSAKKS